MKFIKPLLPLSESVKIGDRVVLRSLDSNEISIQVVKVNRVTFDGIRENGETIRVHRFPKNIHWVVDNSTKTDKVFEL